MIALNLFTQINFGIGQISGLADELGPSTVVLYSPSAWRSIHPSLPTSELALFEAVSGEPTIETVNSTLSKIKVRVTTVVGVGGGSAMDSAKAVAACLEAGLRDGNSLLDQQLPNARKSVRLVLCPSTSGTGSELSQGSILYDPSVRIKRGIRGRGVLADRAIVDPRLAVGCSPEITAETGFDCLAHSIETYVSKKANDYTRELSIFNVRTVFQFLPRAYRDGNDLEAREKLALASLIAGFNLGSASTCLPHRIQYAFDEAWGMSHGLGLAAIYPSWIRKTHEKHGVFRALESVLEGSLLERVIALLDEVGIQRKVDEKFAQHRFQIDPALVKGNLVDDPGYSPESLAEIIHDLRAAYAK